MINLHVHDEKSSLLDSIMSVQDIVKFAKDNGQKAIGLTNHGTMYSYVDFYKSATKNGIKPIIGCEVYEVDDMLLKNDTKDNKQKRYHLILLAKNEKGLKNLFKIVSDGFLKGFYGKPRIDLNYIENNNLGEGIICLTACMAGRLSRMVSNDIDTKTIDSYISRLKNIFDYTSIEIQSHDVPEQIELNKKLIHIANRNNLNYAITTDAHMLSKDQLETHSIFVAIGEGRETGESYKGCYLQSEEEVHRLMDKYLGKSIVNKAILETDRIADMVENIDIGLNKGNLMPEISSPKEFESNLDYLNSLIDESFHILFGHMSKEEQLVRRQRINMELPVLEKLGYIDYFLMLRMLTQEAKKRRIPIGYSRGSGANCLCLYSLGVTQIDSVRWGLDFSRFANLGRQAVADYDMDISKKRRREMVTISEDLFGKDKVAPICTFNTLSTKVAIKDIGKVLDERGVYSIPYALRDTVSKAIPTIKTINDLGEEEEKETLLKDILSNNENLSKVYEEYPLWFKYVMELEGKPKSLGRHAAGTIIAPHNLLNYAPLCLDRDGNQMLQLEMHNAMDDLGLCKMDFLGLENLDIIDDCLNFIGKSWEDFDINKMNLDDKEVLHEIYAKGNTVGIFQMESAEAIKLCMEAKTDTIDDVIAVNAFNRPGTKNGFPEYVKNKLYPNEVKVIHDDLLEIFKNTNFVLLYQEQALQLFRHAYFEEKEVDNARRAIGKKDKDVMASLKIQFSEGLKKRNWNDKQIEDIWKLMLKQAEYSFNKGHSTAYGLLSYLTAYLKHYFPLEFLTACLNNKIDRTEKISIFLNECERLGIIVKPPHINKSQEFYTPIKEDNSILYGLYPIKGVGEVAAKYLIENKPYKSFDDFYNKVVEVKGSPVNKTVIISLIKSGAIPSKNKNDMLIQYAKKLCNIKSEFKPVKTLPTKLKLLTDWNIDVSDYSSKEEILVEYNKKKEVDFNNKLKIRHNKIIEEFKSKYISNEEMYEFDTLSMFLTNNPFKNLSSGLKSFSDTNEECDCVVLASIVEITRKKDKRNNQFAYLNLYSEEGIIEGICWSSSYGQYQDFIKKGSHVAILGTKKENKLIINKIKNIEQWLVDTNRGA